MSLTSILRRSLALNPLEPPSSEDGDGNTDPLSRSPRHVVRQKRTLALTGLLVLVGLADWFFWGHPLGLSVALFAVILAVTMIVASPRSLSDRQCGRVGLFLMLCLLPLVEQVSLISALFAVIGVTGVASWIAYGRLIAWWQVAWMFTRLLTQGATRLPTGVAHSLARLPSNPKVFNGLFTLVLPVAVGLVFVVLLTLANPILERALGRLVEGQFLSAEGFRRLIFWSLVACLIWPTLTLRRRWLGSPASLPHVRALEETKLAPLFTRDAIRNCLILFNGLFLLQTGLDAAILSGGLTLPDGMTYATYAHRGAYPLVVTALLAAIFTILTHQMVLDSRFMRGLLYAWLAQNLLLVLSAAYRLALYVDVYALSHLRLAAFIWMALVLVGLILIIIQIATHRRLSWLISANLITLLTTLYFCCFVNSASVIAAYNLRHATDGAQLDTRYLCGLGEQALPAILTAQERTGLVYCSAVGGKLPRYTPVEGWRDWGLREWRLQEANIPERIEALVEAEQAVSNQQPVPQ